MVDPPTRERIDEKCGTDIATNTTVAINKVRDTKRFQVNSGK